MVYAVVWIWIYELLISSFVNVILRIWATFDQVAKKIEIIHNNMWNKGEAIDKLFSHTE